MSNSVRSGNFTNAQLLCKNECGFYGNSSWDGYCSLCWMKIQKNHNFEELSFESIRQPEPISKRASLSKVEPGEIISRSIRSLVEKKTKEFINKYEKRNIQNEDLGEEISSFYFSLTRLIETKMGFDEEKLNSCMEIAEQNLTNAFSRRLFANEEDESKDIDLQNAIRAFHWIGPAMLGAKLDRTKQSVCLLLDKAVNYFLQTNAELLPRQKISNLSSGVSCLTESVELSTGSPAGADDLLPAIIFLLIYTNPPLFISNLNLIRRLSPPELIRRGEKAYHYCSICSAVEFISRGITAKHLNLTRYQFDQYHSNKEKPPLSLMETTFPRNENKIGGIFEVDVDGNLSSPALQKIRIIKQENERFFERARSLRKQMSDWSVEVEKEVDQLLSRYPLVINKQKPVDVHSVHLSPSSSTSSSAS